MRPADVSVNSGGSGSDLCLKRGASIIHAHQDCDRTLSQDTVVVGVRRKSRRRREFDWPGVFMSIKDLESLDPDTFDLLSVDVFDTVLLRDLSGQSERFAEISSLAT